MAEDVLSHDERLRLEALALATRVHLAAAHTSPKNILETAKLFGEFLRGERAQGVKGPVVAHPAGDAE